MDLTFSQEMMEVWEALYQVSCSVVMVFIYGIDGKNWGPWLFKKQSFHGKETQPKTSEGFFKYEQTA